MQVRQFKGIVPNTFTMGNVVCGFLAILSAFEGQITTACWLVVLASFLDALDGKIARLSHTTSQFGVELDSLSDFLSFGVAPAIIVYTCKLQYMGKWGWLISVVYIMAASYRLARYNIMAETDIKKEFLGLPVPMSATALVTYIIFSYNLWGRLEYSEYLVSMIILFSALMVSQIEYDAWPDQLSNRKNRFKLIFIVVAATAALASPRLLLFPICSLYVIFGLIREMYRFFHQSVGFAKKASGKGPDRKGD